jgi:hypothetical protein
MLLTSDGIRMYSVETTTALATTDTMTKRYALLSTLKRTEKTALRFPLEDVRNDDHRSANQAQATIIRNKPLSRSLLSVCSL